MKIRNFRIRDFEATHVKEFFYNIGIKYTVRTIRYWMCRVVQLSVHFPYLVII